MLAKTRNQSTDNLFPPLHASTRQATLTSAAISLMTTILGGGVLSLPYAFAHSGLIVGYLVLFLIAVASDFSFYLLISSSRRTPPDQGRSYEDVAAYAFGGRARIIVAVLLFALCYLCCVAYLILLRDLWGGIVEFLVPSLAPLRHSDHLIVMLVVVLALTPLCLQHTLMALKNASNLSMLSLIILACAITYRTVTELLSDSHVQQQHHNHSSSISAAEPSAAHAALYEDLKILPTSFDSALIAFPIIGVAFLAHFNVLPLHSELILPTRQRVKQLIHSVVAICTSIYLLIGTIGYIHAGSSTDGNVLNNFSSKDPIIALGRIALAFTCSCTFGLLVLPSKKVMHRLIQMMRDGVQDDQYDDSKVSDPSATRQETKRLLQNQHLQSHQSLYTPSGRTPKHHTNGSAFNFASDNPASSYLSVNAHNHNADLPEASDTESIASTLPQLRELVDSGDIEMEELADTQLPVMSTSNLIETGVILITVLMIASVVDSVATLWSLIGSSISLIITFMLPSAMYIQITSKRRKARQSSPRKHRRWNTMVIGAWVLLVGSSGLMLLCTYAAVKNVLMI